MKSRLTAHLHSVPKGLLIALLMGASSCTSKPVVQAAPPIVLPAVSEIPQFSLPLSVTQAYQAIPHQRTEFDVVFSEVPSTEKAYLEVMFPLIDRAIALRVSTLQEFRQGTRSAERIEQYHSLISFVKTITPPANMSTYHEHIVQALQAQQQFYKAWRAGGSSFAQGGNIGTHPHVKNASSHVAADLDCKASGALTL